MDIRLGYIVILPWMREELNLKGNELLIYALIHGFSQEAQGCFFGSVEYICRACGCTRNTAKSTLKELQNLGLLKKREVYENNVRLCQYTALRGGAKIDLGQNLTPGQNLTEGGAKIGSEVGQKLPLIINNYNKEIIKSVCTPTPLTLPFSSSKFIATWEAMRQGKHWRDKPASSLQLTLKKLSKYEEEFAIELMEATIENQWKGVVFKETPEKYQEWKSARQLAKDNEEPRQSQTKQARPLRITESDGYREHQRRIQEENRKMQEQIARIKAEHGIKD